MRRHIAFRLLAFLALLPLVSGCGDSAHARLSVAYVGRHSEGHEDFDLLLQKALQLTFADLEERTEHAIDVRSYLLSDFDGDADLAYEAIMEEDQVVAILDNTWGSDLKRSAHRIASNRIPVLTLNGDRPFVGVGEGKRRLLTDDRALYLGHEDKMIGTIIEVIRAEIENTNQEVRVCLISEQNFDLAGQFRKDLEDAGLPRTELVFIDVPTQDLDYPSVIESSVAIDQLGKSDIPTFVALCLHWRWGRQVIPLLDSALTGAKIYTGAFGVSVTNKHTLEGLSRSNELIVQTYPSDLVSLEIFELIEELERTVPELIRGFGPTSPLYLRRCSDAMKILEWCLEHGQVESGDVSRLRELILAGFRDLSAGKTIAGETSILQFDDQQGMIRDSTMEVYGQGRRRAYEHQVVRRRPSASGTPVPGAQSVPLSQSTWQVKPAARVGVELVSLSEVDPRAGTFRAELYYWVAATGALKERIPAEYIDRVRFPSLVKNHLTQVVADEDGRLVKKLSGEFGAPFDLRRYPLDEHELTIRVQIDRDAPFKPVLDKTDFRVADGNALARGWVVEKAFETVDFDPAAWSDIAAGEDANPSFNLRVRVSRNVAGPLLAVVLPLVILGLSVILMSVIAPRRRAAQPVLPGGVPRHHRLRHHLLHRQAGGKYGHPGRLPVFRHAPALRDPARRFGAPRTRQPDRAQPPRRPGAVRMEACQRRLHRACVGHRAARVSFALDRPG